jgi:hypothetical protein
MAKIAIGCALASAALAPSAAAATFSDDFAARELVAGVPMAVGGSNVGAGREAGEPPLPPLAPAGHTVWIEWEAEDGGLVTVSTCGSAIDTVFGVYTGSQLDQLTEVGSVAGHQLSGCATTYQGLTFLALAGTKYEIALDGNSFVPPFSPPPATTEGALALQIQATPVPGNDEFAAPTPIAGRTTEEPGGARFYFASERGYNWGAGEEPGEPDHAGVAGGASVWYSWTAPESRQARLSVCCSAVQLLAVYRGDALGSLQPVSSGRGTTQFDAVAGATYRIAVDGELDGTPAEPRQGIFNLVLQMTPPPLLVDEKAKRPLIVAGFPPRAVVKRPPRTLLTKARVRQKAHTATFYFIGAAPGGAFSCRLDGKPWSSCSSPRTYANLGPGSHAFRAYAVDGTGVRDPSPVVSHFSIRPERERR